jgi:aminoglycoside phosphotransferase family enzyme
VVEEPDGLFRVSPGSSESSEWLVKMKRLSEGASLESLITSSRLTEERIVRVASFLSQMYMSHAPAIVVGKSHVASLRFRILSNARTLIELLPSQADVVKLSSDWLVQVTETRSDEFCERAANGYVVDGHGDLRPEHIYLNGWQPSLIDCVEQPRGLRENDVIDELSLLAMECDMLSASMAGRQIMDVYLQKSRDRAPSFLANFYKCFRACERAKECMMRIDPESKWEGANLRKMAQRYLLLSTQYICDS